MSPALAAVEAIYFAAQQNLNEMLAACKTEEERDRVRTQYVQARQNYFACINKAFHDDDPALESLVADAEQSAAAIRKIAEHLGDIVKVINTLTTAVSYGAKIASKVIAL